MQLFSHILQDYFTDSGTFLWLAQWLLSHPEGYCYNWLVPNRDKPQQSMNRGPNFYKKKCTLINLESSRCKFVTWRHTSPRYTDIQGSLLLRSWSELSMDKELHVEFWRTSQLIYDLTKEARIVKPPLKRGLGWFNIFHKFYIINDPDKSFAGSGNCCL